MKWTNVCLLVLLAGTTRAQMVDARQLREVSGRWAEYYAAVYQVPVELVAAIIDEESGWNPYAVSNKGAAGIMQLMPATAPETLAQKRFFFSSLPGLGEINKREKDVLTLHAADLLPVEMPWKGAPQFSVDAV